MPAVGIQTKTCFIKISFQEWDDKLVKGWIQQIREQIPKVFGNKTTQEYKLYILNHSVHTGFILRFQNKVTAQFNKMPKTITIKHAEEKLPQPLEFVYLHGPPVSISSVLGDNSASQDHNKLSSILSISSDMANLHLLAFKDITLPFSNNFKDYSTFTRFKDPMDQKILHPFAYKPATKQPMEMLSENAFVSALFTLNKVVDPHLYKVCWDDISSIPWIKWVEDESVFCLNTEAAAANQEDLEQYLMNFRNNRISFTRHRDITFTPDITMLNAKRTYSEHQSQAIIDHNDDANEQKFTKNKKLKVCIDRPSDLAQEVQKVQHENKYLDKILKHINYPNLSEKLSRCKKDRQIHKKQISSLEKEKNLLEDELSKLKEILENIDQHWKTAFPQLIGKKQETVIDSPAAEIKLFPEKLEKCISYKNELEKSKEILQNQVKTLKQRICSQKKAAEKQTDTQTKLNVTITEKENIISDLSKIITELEDHYQNKLKLEKTLQEKETQINDHHKKIQQLKKQVKTFRDERRLQLKNKKDLEQNLETCQTQLHEFQNSCDSLKNQLQEERAQHSVNLEAAMKKSGTEIDVLERNLRLMDHKIHEITSRNIKNHFQLYQSTISSMIRAELLKKSKSGYYGVLRIREKEDDQQNFAYERLSDQTLKIRTHTTEYILNFDQISEQQTNYEFMDGSLTHFIMYSIRNNTPSTFVLAGMSGSGKSHTLMKPEGLFPTILQCLQGYKFSIRTGEVNLDNNHAKDLLHNTERQGTASCRWSAFSPQHFSDATDAWETIQKVSKNRKNAKTKLNPTGSSRSQWLTRIFMEGGKDPIFTILDLAGQESSQSPTEESKQINNIMGDFFHHISKIPNDKPLLRGSPLFDNFIKDNVGHGQFLFVLYHLRQKDECLQTVIKNYTDMRHVKSQVRIERY